MLHMYWTLGAVMAARVSAGLDVQIQGELTFDLHIKDVGGDDDGGGRDALPRGGHDSCTASGKHRCVQKDGQVKTGSGGRQTRKPKNKINKFRYGGSGRSETTGNGQREHASFKSKLLNSATEHRAPGPSTSSRVKHRNESNLEDVSDELKFDEGLDMEGWSGEVGNVSGGHAAGNSSDRACTYQAPEQVHADAMLSEMTNQLTRVFARMERHVRGVGRAGRGRGKKRFVTVSQYKPLVFDAIFANMTGEFRRAFNASVSRCARAGVTAGAGAACRHQRVVRAAWATLIDSAQTAYWTAALHCMDEVLRRRARARDAAGGVVEVGGGGGRALGAMLLRELDDMRSVLLALLCNKFRLCYRDLRLP